MLKRVAAMTLMMTLLMGHASAFSANAQIRLDPAFDPNRVLEDSDVFDVNGMSEARLIQFLREKGTLADARFSDIDGVQKTAAEIIWRIATSYKINPKYLLALIQKEQSLVETRNPSQAQFDWATGYAICDACSKSDPSVQEFKGFASQIEWAAKQHREKYLLQILARGHTRTGNAAGKPIVVDGMTVIPANNATAMLYSYTPHLHGNLNLWNIWRRWFSLNYPDGTVVRGTSGDRAFLIRNGMKRPFASLAVLQSLVDPDRVLRVSDTELSSYPDGPPIRFSNFALLRDPKHRMWLLTGASKRRIHDMNAFRKFGFNEDEIEDVDDADLAEYSVATPITVKTEFPQGVVLKERDSKKYWYVENGMKRLIPDKVFLTLYFAGRNFKTVSPKKLALYATGNPYRFHDGELVRGKLSNAVSVLENGSLRPILSAEAFNTFGWSWKNVVTVPDSVLKEYPMGEILVPASIARASSPDASPATSSTPLTTL